MRFMRTKAKAAAVLAVVGALAIVVGPGPSASPVKPPLRVLAQAPDARDRLPAAVLNSNIGADMGRITKSRRVGRSSEATYYLALNVSDQVCIVRYAGRHDIAAYCLGWRRVKDATYLAVTNGAGAREIAVLAPDGYAAAVSREAGSSSARRAAVSDNLVVLEDFDAGEIELRSAKTKREIMLTVEPPPWQAAPPAP